VSCGQTASTKVGVYSTLLGKTGKRLLAGEDADMHARLISAADYLPSHLRRSYEEELHANRDEDASGLLFSGG
jgi:hypothetical protein